MLKWIVAALLAVSAAILVLLHRIGDLVWSDFLVSLASNLVAAAVIVGWVDVLRRRNEKAKSRSVLRSSLGGPIWMIGVSTAQLVKVFADTDVVHGPTIAYYRNNLERSVDEIERGAALLTPGVDGDLRATVHSLVQASRLLSKQLVDVDPNDTTYVLDNINGTIAAIIGAVRMINPAVHASTPLETELSEAEAILQKFLVLRRKTSTP